MVNTFNKADLSTYFQQNDIPQGSDYENLIYSQINAIETSAQNMAGALNTTELLTPRVSATNGVFTGTLRVDSQMSANNLTINNITTTVLSAATINVTNVSADAVYASAARIGSIISTPGIVSAAGTAQATAAPLIYTINWGKGIVDGQTTGFALPSNNAGKIQYLYNEGPSANLWPPTGGTINGLAANAAFAVGASSMVTILHLSASAMAAK